MAYWTLGFSKEEQEHCTRLPQYQFSMEFGIVIIKHESKWNEGLMHFMHFLRHKASMLLESLTLYIFYQH